MTDTDLVLYYAPRTRAITALWMLEELGQPYRLESFDLATNRHKEPDYLALNPLGKVPLVVHQGVPVPEIGAMAIYLADRFPSANLAPAVDDPQRPAFLRWVFFASAIMEPAFCEKFFGWNPPASSVAWGSLDQAVQVLTDGVSNSPWLLGEHFTLADIVVGSCTRFGLMFGALPKGGPLSAYCERLTARESFARASAIEAREGERFPPAA